MIIQIEPKHKQIVLQCDRCKLVVDRVIEVYRIDLHQNKKTVLIAKDIFEKNLCIKCLNKILISDHQGNNIRKVPQPQKKIKPS